MQWLQQHAELCSRNHIHRSRRLSTSNRAASQSCTILLGDVPHDYRACRCMQPNVNQRSFAEQQFSTSTTRCSFCDLCACAVVERSLMEFHLGRAHLQMNSAKLLHSRCHEPNAPQSNSNLQNRIAPNHHRCQDQRSECTGAPIKFCEASDAILTPKGKQQT